MKHVYELINTQGIAEHVGETENIKRRFYQHTTSKTGKFYGRTDLFLRVVNSFDTKKEAYEFQNELQKFWGLTPDNRKMARIGEENPKTKLTNEQVIEIRKRYVKGKGAELGREFGVSRIVIGRIVNKRSFKYLD
jgi:predicted GIY-YIG superfamily endonuclease